MSLHAIAVVLDVVGGRASPFGPEFVEIIKECLVGGSDE